MSERVKKRSEMCNLATLRSVTQGHSDSENSEDLYAVISTFPLPVAKIGAVQERF